MALRESNSLMMLEAHTSSSTKKPRRVRNREKVSSDTSSTDQVVMEPNIWKEFPEELFESVIARLPIAAIIRYRSVCRKWNSLPASHTFDQHCSEIKQGYPWLYMRLGSMYDPYGKKYYNHPEPSRSNLYFGFPVASAGGLVCLRNTDEIHICNPLTSSSKKLPPSTRREAFPPYVGMAVSGSSTNNGYKILWLERSGDYEVYDSVKNCWTLSGKIPASVALPLNLKVLSKPVAIESTLYFVRDNPDGIVSYDLASGAWEQLLIPLPLHSTGLPFTNCLSLVECRGNIMLVGLLAKIEGIPADNEALRVCLWELQRTTLSWEEVTIMPNKLCPEFYGSYVTMTCLGNRGLLLLALVSERVHRLVSYDVASRVWQVCQRIPGSMGQCRGKLAWIEGCTMFDPCVTASP